MTTRMLIMAGGTGGHVFPGLAVARVLQARGVSIDWLGANEGIESRLVPQAGLPLHCLDVRGVRGSGLKRKLAMPWMLLRSVLAARRLIRELRPALVLGFGGFASGPGGLAARLSGVPLVIHEQNARAGLTNRVLSRFATRVLEGFAGTFAARGLATGNPVRAEIAALAVPEVRFAGRQGPLRILIIGGSQGALALNRDLPALLAEVFAGQQIEVRHQSGKGREHEALDAWRATGIEVNVNEFIDDMAAAYEWADLLICRAGASTVAEVAAAGVAALFVPLPSAVDDHQSANAHWLVERNAARLLQQKDFNQAALAAALEGLFERAGQQALATRARECAIHDAAERVADICMEVAHAG